MSFCNNFFQEIIERSDATASASKHSVMACMYVIGTERVKIEYKL